MASLKRFLWIFPFTCFLGTYFFLYYFFSPTLLKTPLLIGKNIQEAVQILSDHNLNLRIISQKEDQDIASGTVLSQIPSSNRSIRPHQSVFIVVSKQPEQKRAPTFVQKNKNICDEIAQKNGISIKSYLVTSNMPDNCCIGQLPFPDQILADKRVTLYFCQSSAGKLVLMPSLKKRLLQEVVSFLHEHNLKYSVIHAKAIEPSHQCTHCIIVDQKPLAGSLLDLTKPLTVQLYVQ